MVYSSSSRVLICSSVVVSHVQGVASFSDTGCESQQAGHSWIKVFVFFKFEFLKDYACCYYMADNDEITLTSG